MRLVVLDTETTGLEVEQGHRIIELAGVEIVNRRRTGNDFHEYLNPERDIDDGALGVHGITREELTGKPVFAAICDAFIEYIAGSELVIHNAPFDLGFINAELQRLGRSPARIEEHCRKVTDSLVEARQLRPHYSNSLDALCKAYEVDASQRSYHGALLDAELLADVYLAMTGGQDDLGLAAETAPPRPQASALALTRDDRPLLVIKATAQEQAAHEAKLAELDEASEGKCVWLR